MTDKKFKRYQTYYLNIEGKEVEGIQVNARNKVEAHKICDDLYSIESHDTRIKEIKRGKK